MISKEELGKRLMEARERAAIKRVVVDHVRATTENGLYRIEKGYTYPSLRTLVALMELYKIELPELLKP
jgi:transcriptional regulator with XRE-family HTH domain